MAKWGKWTPSGKTLKCPNCGYRMQVPPNPADKKEPEPKPPSQLARVGGLVIYDKLMPHVLIPATVRLRPVFIGKEWDIVRWAGLRTIAAEIITIGLAPGLTLYFGWDVTATFLTAALLPICTVLPLSILHRTIDDEAESAQPAEAEQAEPDDETTEPEPVGDMAGWMTSEQTDGGAVLRFYQPPRAANGRYIKVGYVRKMAIEIVNNHGWLSEQKLAKLGVPNGPYRLIRQDWLDRRWVSALPDKTTVIETAGRHMIGKIASTPPS